MESENIIQYKWKCGIYQLKDMVELVRNQTINQEIFFDITRFNFDGIVKTHQL